MKFRNLLRGIFDRERPPKEVLAVMEKVRKIAFPKGDEQIAEEAEMLYAVLNKRISLEDLRIIVGVTKPMFCMENLTKNGIIQKIDDSIFQSRSSSKMTSDDIQTIQNFYASYFHLRREKNNTENLENDSSKILERIDLYDNYGIYWGTVDFYNESKFELTKEGRERFYQAILLPSVIGAKKNLTQDNKDAFSRLVGLPQGAWTQSHYCRFSFAFADWISDPVENDFGRPGIRQIKDVLFDFRISKDNYKNQEMIKLFEKCIVNIT